MILHNSPHCRFELSSALSLLLLSVGPATKRVRSKDSPKSRLDPSSFPIHVIPLIEIHLDFQRSISLVPISVHQLPVTRIYTGKLTRLILSPNFAYSHKTSCSRDDNCSFDALVISFFMIRYHTAHCLLSWKGVDGLTMGSLLLETCLSVHGYC